MTTEAIAMLRRRILAFAIMTAVVVVLPMQAHAQQVVLKAVSAFDAGTTASRAFERWIEFVNAEGAGLIRINYVGGGGKIMSVFEMGNALKTGVFDVLNISAGFYANVMPEANVIKLIRQPIGELRKSGTWNYIQRLENEKMNAHLLTFSQGYIPFHIYLRKGVKKPEGLSLKGLRLRSTPNHHAIMLALGANPVRMAPSEIFAGMERGVVDGFGWTTHAVQDIGVLPVTGYRIDPGFFIAPNDLLINLSAWKKLSERQRAVLERSREWIESWLPTYTEQVIAENKRIQAEAGVKVIEFTGNDRRKYLDMAYQSAWDEITKASPQHGPKLRQLLNKPF